MSSDIREFREMLIEDKTLERETLQMVCKPTNIEGVLEIKKKGQDLNYSGPGFEVESAKKRLLMHWGED